MGNDESKTRNIMVRINPLDYEALEVEAQERGTPLATHVRDILQAHLIKSEISEELDVRIIRALESDRFDSVFRKKLIKHLSAQE